MPFRTVQRGNKITKNVEREIINHSNLLHPHIVQFKEVFLTDAYLAIAMEYAAGGDMFQLVRQRRGLPEPEACRSAAVTDSDENKGCCNAFAHPWWLANLP